MQSQLRAAASPATGCMNERTRLTWDFTDSIASSHKRLEDAQPLLKCNTEQESCAGVGREIGIHSFVNHRQEQRERSKGRREQVYLLPTVVLIACLHLAIKIQLLHI